MVEAAGIEPASKEQEPKEPTCLFGVLGLGLGNTHRQVFRHPSLLGFASPYRRLEPLSRYNDARSDLKREEGPADGQL